MLRAIPLGICLLFTAPALGDNIATSFSAKLTPVLTKRCAECHSGKDAEAKLDLSEPRTADQLRTEMKQWFRVMDRVADGSMPPADAEPLTPDEKQVVINWVKQDYANDLR